MPDSVINALCKLLIITPSLSYRYHYLPPFTDKKNEVQISIVS